MNTPGCLLRHATLNPRQAGLLASLWLWIVLFFASNVTAQSQWQSIGAPPAAAVRGIVSVGDTIVVGLDGRFTGFRFSRDLYWRSNDAGATWSEISMHTAGFLFTAHGRIYTLAYESGSLYRLDAQSGWVEVTTSVRIGAATAVAVVGDTVFVSKYFGSNGILMSTDASLQQWQTANSGLPDTKVQSIGGRRGSVDGELFCSVAMHGLYRWGSDGAWHPHSDAAMTRDFTRIVRCADGYYAHETSLYFDMPALYHSADGIAWSDISTGTSYSVRDIAGDGDIVCVATASGLRISTDRGLSWRSETLGEASTYVSCVHVQQQRIIIGTIPFGLFISTDGGNQWTAATPRNSVGINSAVVHGTDLLVGTDPMIPYRFRLSGGIWSRLPVPVNGWEFTDYECAIHSHRGTMYFSMRRSSQDERHDWRSIDNAASWQELDTIRTTAVSTSASGGGIHFFFLTSEGLTRTSDHGETWVFRSASTNRIPRFIAATEGHLYLASESEIRYSTDAGDTWRADTSGLAGESIERLVVTDSMVCVAGYYGTAYIRRHGEAMFRPIQFPAGALSLVGATLLLSVEGGGILRYDENTAQWVQWEEGLPSAHFASIAGTATSTVYAVDRSGVLWSRSLAKTTPVREPTPMPQLGVELWPQPAENWMTLRINGAHNSVRIAVCDVLGRPYLVREGLLEQVSLPLNGLPPGMYMLTATDEMSTVRRFFIRR